MTRTLIRKLRLPLVAGACVLLIGVWSAIAYQLQQLRDEAIESAQRQGENITAVVAEHFLLFAGTVDRTLKHLRTQWLKDPRRFSASFGEHVALPDNVLDGIVVMNAGGSVLYPAGSAVFTGDRDYFESIKQSAGDRLHIGAPIKGRITGKIGIPFAIAIRGESGSFQGVVMASIAAEELIRAYSGIDLGQGGFITLRHVDGTVIVRSKDFDSMLGGGARRGWHNFDALQKTGGSFVRRSPTDGVERVFSFRRLEEYPFIVVAGQELKHALALERYEEQRRAYLAGGALISLVLLLLVLVALGRLKRVERAKQLLALEHTVNRSLAEADDVSATVKAVIRAVCETENWDCGRYFVVDEQAQILRFGDAWGVADAGIQRFIEGSRNLVYRPGDGLSGCAWQSGQPLWSTDVTKDQRSLTVKRKTGLASAIGIHGAFVFPVVADGKTIGVLNFSSRQPREPEERLFQAIHVVGRQIGQFVRRKQAEQILRESEARFRDLTQLSSDVYWEQDEQYRFTSLSGSAPEWMIAARPKLPGKTRWDLGYVNMTPEAWKTHIALLDARKPFQDLELCRVDESGEMVWISVSGGPTFDAAGNFKGYRGVGKDITARKRDEMVLRLEHTVTRSLAEADSVSAALQKILRALCETMDWECGRYLEVDERAGLLRFTEGWAVSNAEIERYMEQARNATYTPGAGLAGSAWRSGKAEWATDLANDPRAAKPSLSHKCGMRGALVFPVTSEGKVIGMFSFNSRKIRDPDERLLRAINVIGSQIGQFLQRKQTEDVMRESEERFRSLTQLSSDWYWEQDENFRFTKMTHATRDAAGRGPLSSIGKTRWDLPALNMTEADWAAHRALLEAHQPFYDLELYRRLPDGKPRYTSVSGEPIFDQAGTFKGYRGVGKDITARRRAEQLRALEHAVNRCLTEGDSASAVLQAVIRAVCETEGWDCGRYFRVDEKAGLLRFSEAWGVSDPAVERFISGSVDHVYRRGVGLSGRAWETGRPLWSADVTKDSRSSSGASRSGPSEAIGMHSAFVFPIVSEGKTIGVLNFASRQGREPEDQLLQAIGVIGGQIGQFLQRKQSEEQLRRFRAAMDASADMFWLIDPVGMRIVDVNDTACQTLGYTREELLAMGPQEIICASREELAEIYRRLIAGDVQEMAVSGSYRRKDGTLLPMESMRRVVRSGNGYVIIAAARDVTERLAREEELRRFRLAMDYSADMIVLIDRATMRFVDVNMTACRLLGYSREELLKMGPQDLLPVSREELERSYDQLIADPARAGGMNTFYRCKDGTQLPFESTRRVLRSGDTYIIAAVSRDIRERLAAEEALRRSNERFNLAVRATNDVIWDWDLVTDELWWNENLLRVFGYSPDTSRTGTSWKECIHPEDRDRIVNGIHDLIHSGGENWSDEYRFLRSDGTYAHVLDRGHVVRDAGEGAVRMIGAMTDITMRKEAEEKLAYLAQFDSLTGLPNRHLFRDRLIQAMARAKRTRNAMAVLFIDLDRFKLINDTLGHSAGDRLLKEATQRLQSCVRSSDTVGRFGGDEFGAIIADLAKPADASLVAQKIIGVLAQPFHLDGHESYVTASVGITLFPADGEEAGTLIMNADAAMYRAKEQGRNTYQYFTREMNERAMQRVRMETALRRAIERREFLLHYQPKVKIGSGEVCGFEALLRWQHPEQGLVPPLQFIPVLEDTGLIVPVGEWVIGEVCRQIMRWQASGFRVPPVAVNLSARQFQQKGLEETVSRALAENGTDPALLQFELTESLLMKEPEVAARTLRGLKELGVMLSVDDFGTGYSSLSYLKRFPIDALKIDRAFIRDVTVDADDAAITFAIIGLAHSLKLSVIAEGVETRDQLRFLESHGCDEMQGFLFSRPVSADECAQMLQEKRRLTVSRRRAAASAGPDERRLRAQGGRG